ncbi:histone-like nucleoid-structuring protein Lsr2 [Microbacterium lacticum]|uniref:Lsr2 protein n=1 Tax=Microbacterium lacticum TaxID=33885 RepID=A0A543L0W9_9MICO|nr:Lsr2 family protein [Microbacterium lacticum]TQN00962.1 Lsr2 protein [Microbacterium lacticum]GGI74398.1 protein lsr2 precursor [Microbacterium lacticum]
MARRIIERLVDDLDGAVLDPDEGVTITFGIDKGTYEIDLSEAHAQELRNALTPYVEAARAVGGRRSSRARIVNSRQRSGYQLSEIRQWAVENGHDVPARGRVPNAVIDAYNAAH